MTATKVCSRCLLEKDITNYYPKRGRCKQCLLELNKEYRQKPEVREKRLKNDREKWKVIKYEKNSRRNQLNRIKASMPEEIERREKKKLERKLKAAQKRIENLERSIRLKRENRKKSNKKIRSTKKGRINHVMSGAIRSHLLFEGSRKGRRHWEALVGYTVEELIIHLEALFKEGMSWDNYGTYWHIDHIRPKSWFKFESTDDAAFKECWSLANLQPLEATINISKQDRYEG